MSSTRTRTAASRMPVTVITGFLGAGKTTLLNRILREPQRLRYAVLINEFGEFGIDADLVIPTDEEIVELSNGCLCCTVRGDLVRALGALAGRRESFEGLLIETSGVADPAAIAQTLLLDEVHGFEGLQLDSIVTVIDARNVVAQIAQSPTAQHQIALADVLLANKMDLGGGDLVAEVSGAVAALNPTASLLWAMRCEVPLHSLLNRSAYSFRAPPEAFRTSIAQVHANTWGAGAITSVSLTSERPVDADDFLGWMTDLIRERPEDLLRTKGIVAFQEEARKFVFHGVMGVMDGDVGDPWGEGEARATRLVLIGRDLDADALRRGFEACLR